LLKRNKGDAAIWVGESILLKALNIETVYVCSGRGGYNATHLRETLEQHGGPGSTAILYHGGGNFGDIWYGEQRLREKVAVDFLDYPIRSFPQTYKFSNPKKLEHAKELFGRHPDLQLTVRDTKSYMQSQKDFGGKHRILLVPDAATMLITSPPPERVHRDDAADFLFLARTDGEGSQNHWKQIAVVEELRNVTNKEGQAEEKKLVAMDWIKQDPPGVKTADWDGKAWLRVNWAYDLLSQGALVISDRLHVHILSTLWGIDHVVVEEGGYAKLKTYHDTWLLDCSNRVVMTQSVREGVEVAKKWYRRGGSFS